MSSVNAPSAFGKEALVAAALSVAGALLWHSDLLRLLAPAGSGSAWLIWLSLLTGLYQVRLCSGSAKVAGRLTLLLIWLLGTVVLLGMTNSPIWLTGWQLLAISVTRSLLFYPKPLAFTADLLLGGAALLAALWVIETSHSLLLAVWSFFLIQAAWIWIHARSSTASDHTNANARAFEAAQATATSAIRRLTHRARAGS